MNYLLTKQRGVLTLSALLSLVGTNTYAGTSLSEAIKEGDASLSFRMRYEDVDQDGLTNRDALTLKTRLNYQSGDFYDFSAFVEMDDVTALTDVDYRTAGNDQDNPGTVVIADPEGTEVNQAYLAYKGIPDSKAAYGRQRITLDNHRFVGHVAWRQNEQTYDSFTFKNSSLENSEIFYGYVTNTNRVFGEDNLVGDVHMDTHLLNASYKFPVGKLSAYYYGIDGDPSRSQLAAGANFDTWDTDTYGVRFAGSTGEDLKFSYVAEYASQSDSGDNPLSYDADYYTLEGGLTVSGITMKLGQETLGTDGTDGYFITPLATLHKFQGWTDKFLNLGKGNNFGGMVDSYFSVGTKIAGVQLLAVYHDFAADDDSAAGTDNYGSEIGFLVGKKFGDYGLQLKYADFSEDDDRGLLTDTSKLWLTASASF